MLSRHGLLRVPAVWVWMKQAVWSVVKTPTASPASGRFFIYRRQVVSRGIAQMRSKEWE